MFHRAVPLLRSAAARSYATATAKPKQDLAPILIGAGLFGSCLFWYSTQGSAKALAESKAPRPAALRNDQFTNFKLETILPYNHNTSRFVFALPEGTTSGLVTASALLVKSATEGEALGANGKAVVRPYTPTTGPNVEGKLELMIKHYPTGVMSSHIFGLKAGDELAFKGPIAKFAYKANEFESITLIAGGSGVTPMWQVMQEIDANPLDKTKVTLLYANVTEADILLRKEFEELAQRKPKQFTNVFVLDQPPAGWKGPSGFIGEATLKSVLPPASLGENIKIFISGPPGQVAAVAGAKAGGKQGEVGGALAALGYTTSQVFKF